MHPDHIWFTSDHHFGHRNILEHCQRPFPDVEAMDEALVARWNARVGDDHVVWHLGDFTLRGARFAQQVFSRLRGRIHVLGYPWHHDRGWVPRIPGTSERYVSASGHHVVIEPPMVVLDLPTGQRFPVGLTLCHFPVAEWDRQHHGAWHLHGHAHGGHPPRGRRVDVGVDTHGFAPWSLREVAEHFGATWESAEGLAFVLQSPSAEP